MAYSEDTAVEAIRLIRSGVIRAFIAILLVGSTVHAQDWTSWTSFGEVRNMRVINDTVYAATSGGLLAIGDADAPGVPYTNLSGLGTNDITDIIEAADGQKWVTGLGRLVRFNGAVSTRYLFADNDELLSLFTLEDDGEFLWVGTSIGLILFSKAVDNGLIKDDYQLFGNLNPSPDVYDIELVGDTILLATSDGLAISDKSVPNSLNAPASWQTYSKAEYDELGSNVMSSVVRFESQIYVGTAEGVYRLDMAQDTLVKLSYAPDRYIRDLKVDHDTLFIYTDAGIGFIKDGTASSLGLSGLPFSVMTGTIRAGERWVATADNRLFSGDGAEWADYEYTGLPANNVSDVSIDPNGLVTVLFRTQGPYELRSGQWEPRPVPISSRGTRLAIDDQGWNWVGTWGAGISRVGDTIATYNDQNSSLRGVSGSVSYIACPGIATGDNLIFASVFESGYDCRVAIGDINRLDEPSGWTYLGAGIISDPMVVGLDYNDGRLAVATDGGLYLCYLDVDPVRNGVDSVIHYQDNSSNYFRRIMSNSVRAVKFNNEGVLWIATNSGVARYDTGIDRFVGFDLREGFGPDIKALEFDSRDNVWIGAVNGLARYEEVSGTLTIFTTRNSGLVNEEITNITFDGLSGDMYISTPGGLSVIGSTIGRPTDDIDSVYAFPNPYVVTSDDDLLNFNFARKADLRIFTVAGELIIEKSEPVWDGRNQQGERVASGVYLFVLNDEDGNVGRGKILLVRD